MLTTERLVLAPFDMKYLQDYFNGFDEEITKFQWPDPFVDIDDARNVLQDFLDEMQRRETLFFSILSKDGKFLGSVEMHGLRDDCPELGIWIVATEQHKGYAYEALSAALRYANAQYDKHEFFYEADVRNKASIKLLHKFAKDYEIIAQQSEHLTTDSGKELILQGHLLRRKCGV